MKHEHNKGKIKDNALKALVRSNLFRYRTEKPKKGKGSYSRKNQNKNNKAINYDCLNYFQIHYNIK